MLLKDIKTYKHSPNQLANNLANTTYKFITLLCKIES